MPSQKKVLSNTIIQIFGKVCTALLSLVVVKILTNLGADLYGNYLTTYEFLAFFGILADAGLFAIAVRELSAPNITKARSEKIFGNVFSIRLIFVLVVCSLAGLFAQLVPSYPYVVKQGILITAISMGLTILAGTLSSVLQARMKIHWFTLALVIGKIFLASGIWHLSQNFSLQDPQDFFNLLWIGVGSNIVFLIVVTYFSLRQLKLTIQLDLSYARKLLSESLPFGLALILQTLYLRLDVILISILLGASSVGIYGVSTRLLESFLVLGTFFGYAMLPKITREEKNPLQANKTLGWAISMLLIVIVPIIIGTTAFSSEIILILSSTQYLSSEIFMGADTLTMILIFTVFFAYFNQLFTVTLVTKKRQKYLMIANGLALTLNAGLNILFLKEYGLIAAALSTVLCEILVFCLLLREIRHFFQPELNFPVLKIILLANAIVAAIIWMTPIGQSLGLSIISCGAVYALILWWKRSELF
jgi:O-antigen/teichoic acid export membrane protein